MESKQSIECQYQRELNQLPDWKVNRDNGQSTEYNDVRQELYDSEQAYLKYLVAIQKLFVNPLARMTRLIKKTDHQTLFGEITSIYNVNKELLYDLRVAPSVGRAFWKITPFLNFYTTYARNYSNSQKVFNKLMLRDDFREFIEEQERDLACQGIKFSALTLMPVQRVSRYILLIERLHEESNNVEERSDLKGVLDQMSVITRLTEACVRDFEKGVNIWPKPERLTSSYRRWMPAVLNGIARAFRRRSSIKEEDIISNTLCVVSCADKDVLPIADSVDVKENEILPATDCVLPVTDCVENVIYDVPLDVHLVIGKYLSVPDIMRFSLSDVKRFGCIGYQMIKDRKLLSLTFHTDVVRNRETQTQQREIYVKFETAKRYHLRESHCYKYTNIHDAVYVMYSLLQNLNTCDLAMEILSYKKIIPERDLVMNSVSQLLAKQMSDGFDAVGQIPMAQLVGSCAVVPILQYVAPAILVYRGLPNDLLDSNTNSLVNHVRHVDLLLNDHVRAGTQNVEKFMENCTCKTVRLGCGCYWTDDAFKNFLTQHATNGTESRSVQIEYFAFGDRVHRFRRNFGRRPIGGVRSVEDWRQLIDQWEVAVGPLSRMNGKRRINVRPTALHIVRLYGEYREYLVIEMN